jgi:NAD(P)-dependent dehydrogenase (short-subunit alcohol dehydrogenase family)
MERAGGTTGTAIVTGGAQGIGRAIVDRLLADGWSVVSVDAKAHPPAGDQAANAGHHLAIIRDLVEPDAAAAVVEAATARFGNVGLLVNNAGIGNARAVHETADEDLQRFLDVNLIALFRMSRAALPAMQAGSCIVNIASVLAVRATPATSSYVATKAAVAGLTRQMAVEYGPRGIRVNAVAPGLIETALTAERLQSDPAFRRIWVDGTPFPRLGRPEDVAGAVRFLASPDAAFVNGHLLVVDGGWSVGNPG